MTGHFRSPRQKAVARGKPPVARHAYLPSGIGAPQDASDKHTPITISDMANRFGVTHRALHFYEEKGLLSAGRIGLMRVYKPADISRMALINACREVGMPVAVIQELFIEIALAQSQEDVDRIFEEALTMRKRELTAALSTIRRQMQQVARLLSQEDDGLPPRTSASHGIVLSELERNCIELMAEGYSTMRLADSLDLPGTEVATLEKSIIDKFGANNRFQAVAKAVLLGILAS
jgi:DNA-binding transcriptional MerR regulator